MKFNKIDKQLFIDNRSKLAAQLKPNSVVIVNANDIMPTNSDGTMTFKQNSNLFYLTGVMQEESIVLLFPDSPDPDFKEVLFLRETSELIESWEGHKLTKTEAYDVSGIRNVQWTKDFWTIVLKLVTDCEYIYLPSNEHKRASIEVDTREVRFAKLFMEKYPLHKYERLAPVINRLRCVKSKYEVELMQKAADITEKGFRRVLKFIKPGVGETEIEAEYIHEYIINGTKVADYDPIIASGMNSCVLHYHQNSEICHDGDLVLMDVAAGYANYNADITRTVPVNGRYTKRQKDVYNAVLRVMRQSTKMIVTGTIWKDLQKATELAIEKELVDLGLLSLDDIKNQDSNNPAYKRYFFHGVSHFLGLDVHDVGYMHEPFKPGMVLTVEPGIYIKEEAIGIRIENNILITETGNYDFQHNVPIEADDIERLMAKS